MTCSPMKDYKTASAEIFSLPRKMSWVSLIRLTRLVTMLLEYRQAMSMICLGWVGVTTSLFKTMTSFRRDWGGIEKTANGFSVWLIKLKRLDSEVEASMSWEKTRLLHHLIMSNIRLFNTWAKALSVKWSNASTCELAVSTQSRS